MLICIVFGGIFLTAGILFFTGAALRWLPSWQAMPEVQRAAVRIAPLCRNVGGVLALGGILLLAGGVLPAFREVWLNRSLLGWFALCILDLVYIGKSGRYQER